MDEATIAANVAHNIPQAEEFTPEPTTVVSSMPPGQATTAVHIDLDELTQYKLHDFFGEPYRANDEIKRQQLQYIYERVADMVDTQDWGFVVSKLRELERIAGITNDDRKMYKMYQWLKLANMQRSIDLQMRSLGDG